MFTDLSLEFLQFEVQDVNRNWGFRFIRRCALLKQYCDYKETPRNDFFAFIRPCQSDLIGLHVVHIEIVEIFQIFETYRLFQLEVHYFGSDKCTQLSSCVSYIRKHYSQVYSVRQA